MASGLSYFSSPPHPTSNPWQRSTNPYYTPQQSTKHNWFASFTPTSPSPLRTARNVNLMSSPLQGGNVFDKHGESVDDGDENFTIFQNASTNPFSNQQQNQTTIFPNSAPGFATPSSVVPTYPTTSTATTTPFDCFNPPPQTEEPELVLPSLTTSAAQQRASQYQFAARVRSSSPAALLQAHTKSTRDSRKRLFLDRLRSRRDEARTDRAGDQVERMDFLRERKLWEADKEGARIGDIDFDKILESEEQKETGGLSPTMEERDVEELAKGYLMRESWDVYGMDTGMDAEFEDDGYDEAFMEVLSQEGTGNRATTDLALAPNTGSEQQPLYVNSENTDMDMS